MIDFATIKEKIVRFATNINSNDPEENQSRQKVVQIAGALVLLVLVFSIYHFSGSKDNNKPALQPAITPKMYDDSSSAQTAWLNSVAPKVDAALNNQGGMNEKEKADVGLLLKRVEELEKNRTQSNNVGYTQVTNGIGIGNGASAPAHGGGTPPPPSNMGSGSTPAPASKSPTPPTSSTSESEIQNSLMFSKVSTPNSSATKDSKKEEQRPFLPTGAITRAKILQGIYAPTMTKAKSNPLPVLMRLTNLSIIPNKKTFDLKECFVLGEGYGELSSERVQIRTTTLSCVTNGGRNIDMPLKGYVSGGDGQLGVPGKVVSKQGAMLARTIIAGFFQGVGQAFGQAGSSQITSALGTTTTQSTDTGTIARTGAYMGASKAAEKLADFYLKMADSIEPVIEVPGGLSVEIIVSQGSEIKILDTANKQQTQQQDTNQKNEEKK